MQRLFRQAAPTPRAILCLPPGASGEKKSRNSGEQVTGKLAADKQALTSSGWRGGAKATPQAPWGQRGDSRAAEQLPVADTAQTVWCMAGELLLLLPLRPDEVTRGGGKGKRQARLSFRTLE